MKKRLMMVLVVAMLVSGSGGFADEIAELGDDVPQAQVKTLYKLENSTWIGNTLGDIRFMNDGSLVLAVQESRNLVLETYDAQGLKKDSFIAGPSPGTEVPALVLGEDGNLYMSNTKNQYQLTSSGVILLGDDPIDQRLEIRTLDKELVYRQMRSELYSMDALSFYSYEGRENPLINHDDLQQILLTAEIQRLVGDDLRIGQVMMADYGSSVEQLFVLVEARKERVTQLYMIELEKAPLNLTNGPLVPVKLKQVIPLAVETTAWIGHMVVTEESFDVIASKRGSSSESMVYRFTHDGALVGSTKVSGMAMSLDANSDQTVVVTKSMLEQTDFAYLITWPTESEEQEPGDTKSNVDTRQMKSFVQVRSRNGQAIAVMNRGSLGLRKTRVEETNQLDYRVSVRSTENTVKFQAPLDDFLAIQGEKSHDLVIQLPDQDVRISLEDIDFSSIQNNEMDVVEKTVEVQMQKDELGNVRVAIQLLVVEQIDEITKVVHRFQLR